MHASTPRVRCGFICLAALLIGIWALAVLGQTAPSARDAGTLDIISAVWRINNQETDITAKVAGLVKDGRLELKVGAAALGVPSVKGATGSLILKYTINGGPVESKTVRGGGNKLVLDANPTGSPDTTADGADNSPLSTRILSGHANGVVTMVFSPDGKMLASAGADKSLILWDTATGKELKKVDGIGSIPMSLAFSRDGKSLLLGELDPKITLFDIPKMEVDSTYAQRCPALSVAFLPDSNHFVSLCGGDLRVWEKGKADAVGVYPTAREQHCLCVTDGGKVITMDYYPRIIEWDPLKGKQLAAHERDSTDGEERASGNANAGNGIFAVPHEHVVISDLSGLWDWDLSKDRVDYAARALFAMSGATADGKYYFGTHQAHMPSHMGFEAQTRCWMLAPGGEGSLAQLPGLADTWSFAVSPAGDFVAMAAGGSLAVENGGDRVWKPKPPFDIRLERIAPLVKAMNMIKKENAKSTPGPGGHAYWFVEPKESATPGWK